MAGARWLSAGANHCQTLMVARFAPAGQPRSPDPLVHAWLSDQTNENKYFGIFKSQSATGAEGPGLPRRRFRL